LAPLLLSQSFDMGLPFFSSHARKRDNALAIDLGGRTTKAVYVTRRGENVTLANYSVTDSPLFEKGISSEALAEHLREVVKSLGNPTKLFTLALGVNDTIFRQVEAPTMPVPDMRLLFRLNSKTYLQQELPDHVFDCQFIGPLKLAGPEAGRSMGGPQKQRVMVGGTKKELVAGTQNEARVAGLVADRGVPGFVGPVNAFELSEPEAFAKEVIAIVEVGFKNSTITILDSGEIMLTRAVAIGGDRVTQGLAESLGVTYPEAENIKLGMAHEVAQNLETLIHPLGRELRASVDYFENHNDKAISKVYISGGSARNEQIFETLQAELMVGCELWSPTKTLQLNLPPERMGEIEQMAPTLSVALGAAAASF